MLPAPEEITADSAGAGWSWGQEQAEVQAAHSGYRAGSRAVCSGTAAQPWLCGRSAGSIPPYLNAAVPMLTAFALGVFHQ